MWWIRCATQNHHLLYPEEIELPVGSDYWLKKYMKVIPKNMLPVNISFKRFRDYFEYRQFLSFFFPENSEWIFDYRQNTIYFLAFCCKFDQGRVFFDLSGDTSIDYTITGQKTTVIILVISKLYVEFYVCSKVKFLTSVEIFYCIFHVCKEEKFF